ncbi:MAG: tellurite resistance TerB family protein [Rhodospirillales bacterium]
MDINSILNNIMGSTGAGIDKAVTSAKSSQIPSGLVGGVAAGGLAALLLSNKKARKMGTKALKYGGMAAVGGLAYKAWRDHKAAQAGETLSSTPAAAAPKPPSGSIFDLAQPSPAASGEDVRLVIVRAMISAAKADGHIDADERARIEGKIHALDLSQDEQTFLVDQLNAPSDPITIARLARNEEQSAEIYIASAMAVDSDTAEEKRYLDRLADALHLPGDLRSRLDAEASRSIDLVA